MSGSAIIMLVVGVVIIWGGLAASITNAVSKSKKAS
ncbi:methionine/alanine import family NSS transporter small subunit [Rossellomorea aquimaris]|nr:methionine/alanine import family NSS transporter small subunit [Rossellomorea aquimaris]MCA1055538.1 methionine/alanine import family NSS transporter small subunit [Rossellomorea aquimaris]